MPQRGGGIYVGVCLWICAVVLAACSGAATPVSVPPTLTLVPVTATPTPTPITPTPTSPDLPSADDIFPTATPPPLQPILASDTPSNADLTRRIVRDLAGAFAVPPDRVQLVQIDAATWDNSASLGCALPGGLRMDDAPTTGTVDGFRYRLLVGNSIYEYHAAGDDQFVRCPGAERVADDVLLAVDPIAADMLSLVQRRVATELDLSSRRVELIRIAAYEWSNTSLGCPQPDQTYTDAAIDGYRIEVRAGGETYLFHTDSVQALRCNPQNERLPD